MLGEKIPKQYTFTSPLANCISGFIAEKEGINKRSEFVYIHLKRFDEFALACNISKCELPESLVKEWVKKLPYESDVTHKMRFWLIRQLGEYMCRQGYTAYVSSEKLRKTPSSGFTPHIFSTEEIQGIIAAADSLEYSGYSPLRHIIVPVLFRLLLCTGLRFSEVLNLKVSDVRLDADVVTISLRKTKFDKERLLPLSHSMGCCIRDYADRVHRDSESGRPFFPSNDGRFYAQCSIHAIYRELLRKAGISHGGKGKGPRIHDMRHTFAVTCLKRWALAGEDMTSALPMLSAYMGHVNLSSTAVYLRLTADLFPYIADASEKHFGSIIPRLELRNYEATD